MCKKKAIATTLQEAIDYYYKVEVIYMLSGGGGRGGRAAPLTLTGPTRVWVVMGR